MIVYDDQSKVFRSTLLSDKTCLSGFGTRMTGDGRKRSTIINYCQMNAIPYESFVIPDQIHSANVEFITNNGEAIQVIDTTDGVLTTDTNMLLTAVTADCVPILFTDAKNGVIGISHQGWRGSLKKMAAHMVHAMLEHGAKLESIKVAIGPSVGVCCYEIYGDRMYEFMAEFEAIKDQLFMNKGGKTHLNLLYLNYHQLVESGIRKEHIDFFPFCTKCDEKRFFSFQRDDAVHYGEMFSYIMKVPFI